jgi:hypothetical protein
MHSEWLLATDQRVQVYTVIIDGEVAGTCRCVQQRAGVGGLGCQRGVKGAFIDNIGNRLRRRVGELGAIP